MAEQDILLEPPPPQLQRLQPPPQATGPVSGMASGPGLPGYAELHCLSNFSFLRGASSPAQLVQRAKALGYQALALTDECSVAGADDREGAGHQSPAGTRRTPSRFTASTRAAMCSTGVSGRMPCPRLKT